MEAMLRSDTLHYLKKILDVSFTHEETAETIVPDSMPDILEIVNTAGMVVMRSKETDTGRVGVSGTVRAAVLYRPDGAERLQKLELNIPFSAETEAPAATPDSKLLVSLRLGSIDARTLNSRKTLVRADVLVEMLAYEPESLIGYPDLEPGASPDIQLLRNSVPMTLTTQVQEKTFVLSDEFVLPAGHPPIEEMLRAGVQLETEDVKTVGNKLIFKGLATVRLLYIGKTETEPVAAEFTASFSQIMEMNGEEDTLEQDVRVTLTNLYVEYENSAVAENTTISVELHMAAQARVRKTVELWYIADTYMAAFNLTEARGQLEAGSELSPIRLDTELRERVEFAEGIRKIIDLGATVGTVTANPGEADRTLRANIWVSALVETDDGRTVGITKRLEATATVQEAPDTVYSADASIGNGLTAVPVGDGLELRVPVRFGLRPVRKVGLSVVTGITWDAEQEKDLSSLPSVTVYRAMEGESFWQLAKKYASTEELIRLANGMEEGQPQPGQLFIIPKRR